MNKGKLYLIPTTISDNTEGSLPLIINKHIKKINVFIVENIRTARRYIKKAVKEKEIDKIIFYSYGKHNSLILEDDFLPHILKGEDVGILSECGMPCIADPGSEIVEYAHNFQIDVIPIVGPSSIFLGLMASGMNGQRFSFIGYLPIDRQERKRSIKQLENIAKKNKETQIFIETPYRNQQLFDSILKTCQKKTKLCLATNILAENEYIRTKTIEQWQDEKIDIHKKPTIFLIG